jgi:hypothetical protein
MCSDCQTRWMAEQASSAELTDAIETELEELPVTDLPWLAGHPYQARRASAASEYAAAHPPVRADPGTPAGPPGRHRHGHRGRDPRCGRHARPRREPGRRAVRRDNRCGLPVPRRPVARRTRRRRRFRRQPRPSIARRTGKPAALSLNPWTNTVLHICLSAVVPTSGIGHRSTAQSQWPAAQFARPFAFARRPCRCCCVSPRSRCTTQRPSLHCKAKQICRTHVHTPTCRGRSAAAASLVWLGDGEALLR